VDRADQDLPGDHSPGYPVRKEDSGRDRESIELQQMRPTSVEEDTRPLIAAPEGEQPRWSYDTSEDGLARDRSRNEVDEAEMEEGLTPGLFIWSLTFSAGVSGLLFGYEYVCPSQTPSETK
jgi:hypothetical protein